MLERVRDYETTFIIRPDIEEDRRKEIIERIENFINDNDGEVKEVDNWDEKELAYEIDDYTTGYYTVIEFEAKTGLINELEYEVSILPDIIRNLIVRQND